MESGRGSGRDGGGFGGFKKTKKNVYPVALKKTVAPQALPPAPQGLGMGSGRGPRRDCVEVCVRSTATRNTGSGQGVRARGLGRGPGLQ